MRPSDGEKIDPAEAEARADELGRDPQVRSWLRRAAKLFADQPKGCWIYMQEDHLHLMARAANGDKYVSDDGGSEQRSSIASIMIPGADAGAW